MPSPGLMPAMPAAIPVAKGFTTEARQPPWVPNTTIITVTMVSSPRERITGMSMRR